MSLDPENGEGHVDGFDESEDFSEDDLVTFEDEDGNTWECVIVAVIEQDGGEYVMLQPKAQLEDEEQEEIDTFLFSYSVNADGLPEFSPIDDDELFAALIETFSEM
ncbi:MAG: DUF1292 domain-containing protein [Myxococcales bacterium]|nr:DUF1292 domain-containing protein [Myxococcales bacterium]